MKAGRLLEVIAIQRATSAGISDAGTPDEAWVDLCTLRAERAEQASVEAIEGLGAVDTETVVLRARFFEGVTNADRVIWNGDAWNIKRVSPIGRRKGIELHCERVTP
ncbi:head-tail adaptor protein [Sinirhodobacter populi]|uniref:Head-tail adaptor protein n=1 Tax=Paenirhodobacter populi TaxID=2306993 RepID=A0A443K9I6_9RHOB|nr:head-tail adaptor protein [Sinirhodobacter populi]RWR29459.1 head-tail adaptor protein [Sinirhodobacter populi]